jgi:type I restriction enzyme S subunit
MKPGWDIAPLCDISKISYGYTESANSNPIGPHFLRITDIQNDSVNWESVPYCKIESIDIPKYRLANGDIVFARTGATTGKSFLVSDPPEAVFASYLIRLRLNDTKLLPAFVSLYFQSTEYWKLINEGSSGSAQGGFNASKLGALTIPIPPLSEQQRIVAILGEAFEIIATAKSNAEKNLQNASKLFESHLKEMFDPCGDYETENGWIRYRLGDITSKIGSGATPLGGEKAYQSSGISLIRSLNVHDSGFRVKDLAFIDEKQAKQLDNVIVEASDVLLNITGASIARCSIASKDLLPARVNQHVSIIRAKKNIILPEFLYFLLISKNYKDKLLKAGEGGATRQALTKALIEDFQIEFPESLDEQQKVVSQLDLIKVEIQRLENIYRKKIDALNELKKSLLHQAFKGEL